MKTIEKVGTFNGTIIYHYNFTNKNGVEIQCTKYLFSVNGLPVYVNAKADKDKKIGAKVIYDLGYDGSRWVLI